MTKTIRLALAATALAATTVLPAGAAVADSPSSDFATNYSGCLGGLRSAIARGDLAGVALPDGTVLPAGFSGDFNPGDHLGTVGEREFVESHGVTGDALVALCGSF